MKKGLYIIFLNAVFLFSFLCAGLCLDSKSVIMLKKAGISDETIQIIIEEKTIETCAFTAEEIVELKKAGISNETIQMLVKSGSFMKDTEPIIYGRDIKSIKFTTAKDIVELKEAGLSDDVIKAIIICGSGDENDIERAKAWEMLNNMGIIIDKRKGSE